ncbi:MAG: type II toxin-antitoxin system VapC family toxin [Chloroflexi bacterium]|nr:type II toxin-antitoxin system VapC family toxin [Chloroflexota bacterium]
MPQFIIDSGAFLALLNAKDRFHPVAKQFALANREAVFFIPEFIFAETMTLIKARFGQQASDSIG